MTHDVIVLLSALGVAGQVIAAALLLVGVLALFGVRGPLRGVTSAIEGYDLWLAFVVARSRPAAASSSPRSRTSSLPGNADGSRRQDRLEVTQGLVDAPLRRSAARRGDPQPGL